MLLLKLRIFFLLKKMKKKLNGNVRISVVESCSGGSLSAFLTRFSGASNYFEMGLVTYSKESKSKLLNIDLDLINKYGAVSGETALLMSKSLHKISQSDINIAITGIAGPESDGSAVELGCVYISICSINQHHVVKFLFKGSREKIRLFSCYHALRIIYEL
jgi:PncC family amidohydrolase